MAAYRLQIVLRTADNNPANYITNTWYCAAVDDAAADDFAAAVITFHRGLNSSYSEALAQNDHEAKLYNMSDPEPRAPISEDLWSFVSAPSADSLPHEVALCLSFQAAKLSGAPQARRRGRVYLGPFDNTSNVDGRPSSTLVNTILTLAEALYDAGVASVGDWNWAVYSTVNVGTVEVTNGWVDDEWDTQRRRGRTATARNVWP